MTAEESRKLLYQILAVAALILAIVPFALFVYVSHFYVWNLGPLHEGGWPSYGHMWEGMVDEGLLLKYSPYQIAEAILRYNPSWVRWFDEYGGITILTSILFGGASLHFYYASKEDIHESLLPKVRGVVIFLLACGGIVLAGWGIGRLAC